MKRAYLIVIAVFVLGLTAHAINLNVYCGQRRLPNSINAALKLLNPAGPNTLTVSGTCKENVLIQGFNRLTLRTTTGATINDASGGTGFVVDIEDSTDIEVQGFTINGGTVGIHCADYSVCRFDGNTVQGAGWTGILIHWSRVTFGANTIQNNGNGLSVFEKSSVRTFGGLVIQQNQGEGVDVESGSSFESFGDTIQNNGGNGVAAYNDDYLLLLGTTVTRNSSYGVAVLGHSSADFAMDNVITGNGLSGVLVRDLSYVDFYLPSTVTGNGSGTDVECEPQFPVANGVLTNIGGGTTNCTGSSAPAAQHQRGHFGVEPWSR